MLALPLLGLAILGGGNLPAQKPENVLVVANRPSAVSKSIAEYYARRRGIPANNVCYLETAVEERVSRQVYDQQIAASVARCLESRSLAERVLFLVTTLGVPLVIQGPGAGMTAEAASVDSELTLLYQQMKGRKHPLPGPLRNPFFGQRDSDFAHPAFPMYLVTRLAGYDFADVRGIIDRSMAAENRGQVVLDLKSAGEETGNDWLRTAAVLLPAGRVVLDETPLVLSRQKDVIGYASWGSNDRNRKERWLHFEWLPGAIVTEYVSTNGRTFERPPEGWQLSTWSNGDSAKWFKGSPQTLSADYIHEGATGASGHIEEPFLRYTPRPDYLFPAYLGGRTLAESYYLAIPAVSWMNIVIGDPLCRLGPAKK
ncbi:MAG: TIGR03790 family protein [Acidobacteria bacterium]|nr:TIGR03790 family protein [Acidobacteriota bacterium]